MFAGTHRFQWFHPEWTRDDGTSYQFKPSGAICLPKGAIWQVTRFGIMAETTYAAADTNYLTARLLNSDFAVLGVVANGDATSGQDIGPTAAGITTTISSTCGILDATSAEKYLLVDFVETGTVTAKGGISGFVDAVPVGRA